MKIQNFNRYWSINQFYCFIIHWIALDKIFKKPLFLNFLQVVVPCIFLKRELMASKFSETITTENQSKREQMKLEQKIRIMEKQMVGLLSKIEPRCERPEKKCLQI